MNINAINNKWDSPKKVHTSVESNDSSRTMSKENYDILKAETATDLTNSLGGVVTLEPVGKLKTTVVSAVQYQEATPFDQTSFVLKDKVTAFTSEELANNPFDLRQDLKNNTLVNGASTIALGAAAVAVATLAFSAGMRKPGIRELSLILY